MFENSVTFLAVANAANGLTDGTSTVADLPVSAAGIFREIGDAFEKSASIRGDSDYFYVAWKDASGNLSKSPRFQGTKISEAASKAAAALTEQVSYVGYNGTSGSIVAANSTYYGLRLVLNHTFGAFNNSPLMKTIPYKSDASATASEIAAGLALAGNKSFARGVNQDVLFERINSGAVADALGTATAAVVNGSKDIVFSEDMTSLVTVGTIVRLGGLGAGTTPVYIVASHDGGAAAARVYTFDQPYTGATNAALAANLIESVTEGDWGLKLTGQSIADADFNYVSDTPYVVSFDVELSEGFGATLNEGPATKPSVGIGTYQLVSSLESRTQFEARPRTIRAYPPTVRAINAVAGKTYEIVSFVVVDDGYQAATTGFKPVSPANILIATETSLTTDIADYVTVLAAENLA